MVEEFDFNELARELGWNTLDPGTLVVYQGGMLSAHGVYRVHSLNDRGYVLTTDEQPYLRLNAQRHDLTPVEGRGHE